MEEFILVKETEYPSLWGCLEEIAYDCGVGHEVDPDEPLEFKVPKHYAPELAAIESALSLLTRKEVVAFTTGEETAIQRIATRSTELGRAYQLMQDFFEGPML